jgi:hypothetical protein
MKVLNKWEQTNGYFTQIKIFGKIFHFFNSSYYILPENIIKAIKEL